MVSMAGFGSRNVIAFSQNGGEFGDKFGPEFGGAGVFNWFVFGGGRYKFAGISV